MTRPHGTVDRLGTTQSVGHPPHLGEVFAAAWEPSGPDSADGLVLPGPGVYPLSGFRHGQRIDLLCAAVLPQRAWRNPLRSGMDAYELMRGVGNLCIGADSDPRYDARRLVELLIAGLPRPQ